ncbi:MAG: type IV pili methyl-accepting chemotaxis transducer N-terminal domain-containing protein [Pseudomonadales bacterium]|nr:type IV pili methyl-accepting chemotaxis transducer N-terminal domain-containing protein [Pseudomonadales bacterium]
MAERPGVVGNIIKNPTIVVLVIVLALLIAGYAANFYFVNRDSQRVDAYVHYASELKVLSQEVAKNAAAAMDGQTDAFDALAKNRNRFDTNLGYLKDGNPVAGVPASPDSTKSRLQAISGNWNDMRQSVDIVLANKDATLYLRDSSSDLSITMSAIQQENNKIVASMLRLGASANEVALAQRQNLLIERMSRNVDKMVELGGTDTLTSNFTRDAQTFKKVLDGLVGGDRELLLTAATSSDIQSSLTRVEELYRSISARVNEILSRAGDVVKAKQAARAISITSPSLLEEIEGLTAQYEEQAGVGLASPLVGIGSAGGAFLVILIIALMVYRDANRNIRESAVRNEQNQAAILQLLDELADLADGDLRVQATVTESFTGAIADSINFSIDQMRGLVSQINQTSAQVSSAAEDTKGSVSKLSEASQRQSKEISDVSEAVNQMAVSIDQVSYNAAESSSVAERSVDIASKGAVVVQNTIDGMDKIRGQIQETAKRIKRLGESSQEIGDIVSLINDIADQTNILSLNAAIQASMAGDAGKGFAVVADEVQRLAERSGAAAKQIAALVKTIQSDTNEAVTSMEQTTAEVVQGTRLAQDAGVSLGEIEGVSKTLAEIIENISDAARQQAASAGRISNTMKSIQEITQQTTEGTRSTVIAVGNLADMTNELRSSVTGFKLPD